MDAGTEQKAYQVGLHPAVAQHLMGSEIPTMTPGLNSGFVLEQPQVKPKPDLGSVSGDQGEKKFFGAGTQNGANTTANPVQNYGVSKQTSFGDLIQQHNKPVWDQLHPDTQAIANQVPVHPAVAGAMVNRSSQEMHYEPNKPFKAEISYQSPPPDKGFANTIYDTQALVNPLTSNLTAGLTDLVEKPLNQYVIYPSANWARELVGKEPLPTNITHAQLNQLYSQNTEQM